MVQEIAILGMACRFPGAPSLDAFWSLLEEGRDAMTSIPSDRWDAQSLYHPQRQTPGRSNALQGGFLDDIGRFDARFFGISDKEAAAMDPQQRILLELC